VTAIDLDEDLTIEESPWRGRIISFVVMLVAAVAIAAGLYFFYFKSDSTAVKRSTEDIPVKKSTINQMLIISGVADAELNSNLIFQASGKVATVDVKVGDTVKQGDVLASLESDDLSNAVASAQANLQAAQLKLNDLLDGATASEKAAADQAVAAAEANVTKIKNDLQDLVDAPKAADLAAAQQALDAAGTQLATARSNRQKLSDAPTASDLAAAQAGVAAAQSALTAAQNAQTSAGNALTSTDAALKNAETIYCAADSTPAFCTTRVAPLSSADAALMDAALAGSNHVVALGVVAANSTYMSAANSAASAAAAVTSAQQALTSAQGKLSLLQDGPTSADIAAAEAAVTSAESGVATAEKRLTDVTAGATDSQKATALSALKSALAALDGAVAKRDDVDRGATQNAADQGRTAVKSAQLTVEAARIRLKNAQIIAPFDGVVGAVNAKAGEFFAPSSANGAAIVLLTPDRLRLKIDVGETDYANIKLGQVGGGVFDSIPGKIYPFVIGEIGLSPSITQGVVTYQVKASLIVPADAPRPAPGMNARGQIITESKAGVLVVPPRAIRRSGNNQVVDVRRNGGIEEQVVTTGATDTQQVEILTGLSEGDVVVVAALTSARPGATPKPQPTLPGGVK
jgi:RND family efflux transporter MFP subunit